MKYTKKLSVRLIQTRIREIQDAFPVLVKKPTERDRLDFNRDAAKMRSMLEELWRELNYIQKKKTNEKELLLDEEINLELYEQFNKTT